jgi:hypothetical protein
VLPAKSLIINTRYRVSPFLDLSINLAFLAILPAKSLVRLWPKTEIELEYQTSLEGGAH